MLFTFNKNGALSARFAILVILFAFPLITAAQTVYVTQTGHKYHQKDCSYLKFSSRGIELSAAKSSGYKPCLVCQNPNSILNSNQSGWIYWLSNWKIQLFAFLIFILFLLYFFRKKLGLVHLFQRRSKPNLSPLEYKILDMLISNEEMIDTNKLNTILSLDAKSMDAQRKSRARFLMALNEKLSVHLKSPDIIERITIEEDKRMVYYSINSQSKAQLKQWYKGIMTP
jgi:DNA-binding MarR family transcriptional regulator